MFKNFSNCDLAIVALCLEEENLSWRITENADHRASPNIPARVRSSVSIVGMPRVEDYEHMLLVLFL
jgi:hypothetical protein